MNKFSSAALAIILLMTIFQHLKHNTWNKQPAANSFHWDNFGYYLYLPAIIENKDLETLETTGNYFDAVKPSPNFYQVKQTETLGKPVIVYPMGMALFNALPYIATKAVMTLIYDDYSSFDRPFHVVISLWSLAFVWLSLFLIRRLLLMYFSDKVAAIALLLLIFGTNTFFYFAYFPQIAHPVLFGFYVLSLHLIIKWHQTPRYQNSILLGLCFSMCMLIRPSSFFLIPLFLLWDIPKEGLWVKVKWLFRHYKFLIVIVLSAFLLSVPQLLYWKMQSGSYLYFSYAVDWFDFSQPHIWKGIFGTRSGWAFHHPLVLALLLSLTLLFRNKSKYSLAILTAAILQIWFILSWSNYWYGSGFGHRGFTEFQAILIFPFALLIQKTLRAKPVFKILGLSILVSLSSVGLIRIVQYDRGIWGMANISPQYAKDNYLAVQAAKVDFSTLYTKEEGDEVLRKRIENEAGLFQSYIAYKQDFSFTNHPYVKVIKADNEKVFSLNADVLFSPTDRLPYNTLNQKPGSGAEFSVRIMNKGANAGKTAYLVFEVSDAKNKTKYFYSSTAIRFNELPENQWETVFDLKDLPDLRFNDDIYSIYLYNPEACQFYADDISIRSLKYTLP